MGGTRGVTQFALRRIFWGQFTNFGDITDAAGEGREIGKLSPEKAPPALDVQP